MHKVAKATSIAFALLVLTAARLAEISHRRQLGRDRATVKPPVVQPFRRLLSVLLVIEHHVHITDKVVTKVVAHIHLFDFAVLLLELPEDILEKVVVVRPQLLLGQGAAGLAVYSGRVGRIVIQVTQHHSLRIRWFVVKP